MALQGIIKYVIKRGTGLYKTFIKALFIPEVLTLARSETVFSKRPSGTTQTETL